MHKSCLNGQEWSIQVDHDFPKQNNKYDCGAFVCLAANLASLESNFHFSQDDMAPFKQQMSKELLSKSLESPVYAFRNYIKNCLYCCSTLEFYIWLGIIYVFVKLKDFHFLPLKNFQFLPPSEIFGFFCHCQISALTVTFFPGAIPGLCLTIL